MRGGVAEPEARVDGPRLGALLGGDDLAQHELEDAALVLPANALSGAPEAAVRSIQIQASVIESMDLGDRTRVTCLVECGETGVPVRVSGDRLRTVSDVSPGARLHLYVDADLVSVVA